MMRLMVFAAIGISSFAFTGFSRGIVLPTSHSDLALNRPTGAQTKAGEGEREKREREKREREKEKEAKRPSPQSPI